MNPINLAILSICSRYQALIQFTNYGEPRWHTILEECGQRVIFNTFQSLDEAFTNAEEFIQSKR